MHVLYFTADWCNPCARTKPVAEDLKRDGIIDFQFIDADSQLELVNKFEIKSIPTYILIKDGKEIKRMNGAKTREQFLEFINNE
ncbi:MAG: thioredoxin [Chitinophagia bacterium]|jgi:thioredoxin-like negative regulator of GroEL|nr:thioredoxin [Chitinophagia bacterium]